MITTVLIVLLTGSTLILSTAAIMTWLLPRCSAANRFSIWQIAVTSLMLLPIGVFVLPEIPLGLVSSIQTATPLAASPANDWNRLPSRFSSTKTPTDWASPQRNPTTTVQIEAESTSASSTMTWVTDLTRPRTTFGDFRFTVSQAALIIWLAVALALLIRTVLAHCRVALATRAVDLEIDSSIADQVDWFPASVVLAYSDRLSVPVTVGIVRRRIILPTAAVKWPTDQVRMVLKHELAHVRRRDVLWQTVTSIVTSFFWFQPLAWWAERKLKIERERACDDQVIAGGEQAADYATVLVQLAATFSGRATIPIGALSMAQKTIERRLATILSPSTSRTSTNHWLGSFAAAITLMVVAGVCSIRPFAPLAIAAPVLEATVSNLQDSQQSDLRFPSRLTGLVVDEDGKPVVGAELHLSATPRLNSEAYHFDDTQATVRLTVVKTDGLGMFVVNIDNLANDLDIWSIKGKVIAENRPPAPMYKTVRKGLEPVLEIRTIRFQPGKTISGRVVPPVGSSGLTLTNPVITVRPIGMLPSHKWLGETVECQPDGSFSVMVASDVRVSVLATADNFAGTGLEVQPQVRNLNDIPLQAGTVLKGKMLDRAGRPVAGVLVYSDSDADDRRWYFAGEHTEFQPYFSRHSKTNGNGEFELDPQSGQIRVSLRQSIFDPRSNKNMLSERVPPVIVPIQIDLETPGLAQSIDLQEAQTVRASGAICWPDGSPVIGVEATVNVMIGSSGTDVFSTTSDSSGRYTVLIPKNMRSSISVFGARDSANEWHVAKSSTTSEKATQQSSQILGLAPLSEDISGLDWKLSKREAAPLDVRTPAERELHNLFTSRNSDEVTGQLRIAGAANDHEKKELLKRYEESRKQHTANLIAFEAEYRGEFVGAVALATFIDPEQPEQLDAFTANYLGSPNADVVLSEILLQGNPSHARKMLKTFAEDSPHATIQAAGMFYESAMIAEALMNKEYYQQSEWYPAFSDPKTQEEKDEIAQAKQVLAEMMLWESEQLLSDYVSILTTLKTEYSEHGNTVVHTYDVNKIVVDRAEAVRETYASQLQEQLFQLENLRSGQPLPRLVGRDVQGVDFDSERLKGKAVLLFFTSNLYTDRPNFLKLRELKKRYAGRPFEIVSVMVDLQNEEAKAAVDTGKITWSTLYDVDQQLMKKWQLNPCSDRLLVDHQGIIHRRAPYGTQMDDTIELLVSKAERK